MSIDYLKNINKHPRDENISFEEGPHIYTVMGERGTYTSVTTWVHKNFEHFNADKAIDKILQNPKINDPSYKYYGLNREQIKRSWDEDNNRLYR